jgi:hypothetical protein
MGYILSTDLPQTAGLVIPANKGYVQLFEKPLLLQPPTSEIWTITQISAQAQIGLATEPERSTVENSMRTEYPSEAKAQEATEEGVLLEGSQLVPYTISSPWELIRTSHIQTRAGVYVTEKQTISTERSVFPIEAEVLMQITDSGGVVWSNAMQGALRSTNNALGQDGGYGAFSDYSDLVNTIDVYSGQRLTLSASLFIPLRVNSNTETVSSPGFFDITYTKRQAEGG